MSRLPAADDEAAASGSKATERRGSVKALLFGGGGGASRAAPRQLLVERSGAGGRRNTVHGDALRQAASGAVIALSSNRTMVKTMHVVVAGPRAVGKTAILSQLALLTDLTKKPYRPTSDDTFQVQMDPGDRPREIVFLHDTAGQAADDAAELKRPYIQVADAFILVYSVADAESFNRVDLLKKFLDRQFGKEKKEVPIVVLGNKTDLGKREVEMEFALMWSQKEKVKLYEVTATDRKCLLEPFVYLGSRYFHPAKESKFSLSRKLKPEKSGAAIVMDI